jgi:hypothetical protein
MRSGTNSPTKMIQKFDIYYVQTVNHELFGLEYAEEAGFFFLPTVW